MSISELAKRLAKLTADNSPAIFTAIGVAGTLTTAALMGRAGFKAAEILSYAKKGERFGVRESIELKEKVELTWKCYIAPASTAVVTIASIILANRIGNRRAAALAAAYAISEKAFLEYKDKVVEKLGERKEQEVRDEINQERIRKNPFNEVAFIGEGSVLCFDAYTGRYFLSDIEKIRRAENQINYNINHYHYASLNELYDLVGLEQVPVGEEMGWNADKLLEIEFGHALRDDGKPCLVMGFRVLPIRDYHRVS